MSRSLFAALFLMACAPALQPAEAPEDTQLRADQLGDVFDLGGAIPHRLATNDRSLFVLPDIEYRWCSDQAIEVYDVDDTLPAYLWEPSQVLPCPDNLPNAHLDWDTGLDARDDLLLAGPHLYRRTAAGYVYETRLGERTPAESADRAFLVGDGQAVLVVGADLYVYTDQGAGRWRNTQRLAAPSGVTSANDIVVGDDLILVRGGFQNGSTWVFGRAADGRFTRVDTSIDAHFEHLHGGTLFEAVNSRATLWTWNGTDLLTGPTLDPEMYLDAQGWRRAMVTDGRVTLTSSAWTRVWNATDGSLLGLNDEQPLPMVALNNWVEHSDLGASSYVTMAGPNLNWVHLIEPVLDIETNYSFSQVHELTLEADEVFEVELEIPDAVETLSVQLFGNGDADLYVRRGASPTPADHDCAPYLFGSEESCSFDAVEDGIWFVQVVGFETLSEVTLAIEADDPYPW